MGYSPAAGRENRLAVRYREVALSELATRLHIAMSDAVTTPAERTTCHDRSSQPSDFASAKSGTATASAMRKIWAARTGGCWLIRELPVHAHVAFVGVGGIATHTHPAFAELSCPTDVLDAAAHHLSLPRCRL
jgi:hypothetical protein